MPTGVETVALVPERETDSHGDPVGDAPEPVEVRGAITWPRTSTEESA